MLAGCAKIEKRDVDLHLPKFKLEPPTITLAKQFEALGMKTAFDQPKGSANFDKIAPRTPDDYLYISQIFHKTFIAVDEKGTEAAAATAVAMLAGSALRSPPPPPIEVKVDRPFVYAIQHVPSGVCLFSWSRHRSALKANCRASAAADAKTHAGKSTEANERVDSIKKDTEAK